MLCSENLKIINFFNTNSFLIMGFVIQKIFQIENLTEKNSKK
jgi:hypothetical protein